LCLYKTADKPPRLNESHPRKRCFRKIVSPRIISSRFPGNFEELTATLRAAVNFRATRQVIRECGR
jgi:hypothetical protein